MIKTMNISPLESIMVVERINDIKPALELGINTFWYNNERITITTLHLRY